MYFWLSFLHLFLQVDWNLLVHYTNKIRGDQNVMEDKKKYGERIPHASRKEQSRKALVAEIKLLYTAITRARRSLWIYSERTEHQAWHPLVDYWIRCNYVQFRSTKDQVFAAKSSSNEDWERQGKIFVRRHLWDVAIKCFKKAKAAHLVEETIGHSHFMQEQFVAAASCYALAYSLKPTTKFLQAICLCLSKSKTTFVEAATLLEKVGEVS